MFLTDSYSAFFTSGLLSISEYKAAPPSESAYRGSLPVTVSLTDRLADDSSAFYFSLQPKRNTTEFRSFLSLDLAESQSLRSASLKRKAGHKSALSPITSARWQSSLYFVPARKPVPSSALPAIPQDRVLSNYSTSNAAPVPLRRRGTRATTSTVSTNYRRTKRNDALARLEGRIRPAASSRTSNFMCLIDEDEDAEELEAFKETLGLPPSKNTSQKIQKLTVSTLISALSEDENIVLPHSPKSPERPSSSKSSPRTRKSRASSMTTSSKSSSSAKRRLGISSWLPLHSFMDLHDLDEETNNTPWRSFIEISTLS